METAGDISPFKHSEYNIRVVTPENRQRKISTHIALCRMHALILVLMFSLPKYKRWLPQLFLQSEI
jgi:hypothetical protein